MMSTDADDVDLISQSNYSAQIFDRHDVK